VHHRVVRRLLRQVELVEGRQPGQGGVHLAGVGEVDGQVGDVRVAERGEVGVGDLVADRGEVRRHVVPGLAAATGEEDAHVLQPTGSGQPSALIALANRLRPGLLSPGRARSGRAGDLSCL
jgi:hypothetical protein